MRYNRYWVILAWVALSACDEDKKQLADNEKQVLDTLDHLLAKKTKPIAPQSWSYLERQFMPKAKLYGKFFEDRVQFHIVNDPALTLYRTSVKELTFYHIDEELAKKKFLMYGDISSDLMETYGNFKLKPLDSLSKFVAKTKTIIKKVGERPYLNEELRQYEMRWEKQDKTIRYRVSSDSTGTRSYELSEEIPDYAFLFNSVEYGIGLENIDDGAESSD